MSEQVTKAEDVEQGHLDAVVMIARPDCVMDGTAEEAIAAHLTTFQHATIQTKHRVFLLLDEALPDRSGANRWQVRVEPSGVLNVSAWLDKQDRDLEEPQTVLILAPGVWKLVRGLTKDFGED